MTRDFNKAIGYKINVQKLKSSIKKQCHSQRYNETKDLINNRKKKKIARHKLNKIYAKLIWGKLQNSLEKHKIVLEQVEKTFMFLNKKSQHYKDIGSSQVNFINI